MRTVVAALATLVTMGGMLAGCNAVCEGESVCAIPGDESAAANDLPILLVQVKRADGWVDMQRVQPGTKEWTPGCNACSGCLGRGDALCSESCNHCLSDLNPPVVTGGDPMPVGAGHPTGSPGETARVSGDDVGRGVTCEDKLCPDPEIM